jgi:hypothetical protein
MKDEPDARPSFSKRGRRARATRVEPAIYLFMTKERRSIVMHNNKTVIFLDHSNLSGAEYLSAVEESRQMAENSGITNRLIMVDVTGSVVDKDVLRALKALTTGSSARISKIALLGTSGIQSFFTRTISMVSNTNIRPFRNREDALEWLTS